MFFFLLLILSIQTLHVDAESSLASASSLLCSLYMHRDCLALRGLFNQAESAEAVPERVAWRAHTARSDTGTRRHLQVLQISLCCSTWNPERKWGIKDVQLTKFTYLKKECLCTLTWTCAMMVRGSGLACPPLVTGGFRVLGVEGTKQGENTLEVLCLGFWSAREQMEVRTVLYSSPGRLRQTGTRAHTLHFSQPGRQAYNYTPTHTMPGCQVSYYCSYVFCLSL